MADKSVKDVEVIEEKDEKLKNILKTAWDIFFWLCFICVLAMWIYDFVNTKREQDPVFCITNKTIEVDGGTVEECLGVGYKVFTYHTDDMEGAREFGAFWIQPRK